MNYRSLVWLLGIILSDEDLENDNYYDLSDFFEIEQSEGRLFEDSPLSDEPLPTNNNQFTEYYYQAPIYSGIIEADIVDPTETLKTDDYEYTSVYDDASASSSEFDHLRLQNEFSFQVFIKNIFHLTSNTITATTTKNHIAN